MRNVAALAILLLAIGCPTTRPTPAGLEALQNDAKEAFERADYDRLGEIAKKGLLRATSLGDPEWIWRFKHLWFEFLINNGRNSELLPVLEGAPPDDLRARILLDRARAQLWLERAAEAEADLKEVATLPLDGEKSLPVEFSVARADLLVLQKNTLAAEKQYKEALQEAIDAHILRLQIKAAGNLAYWLKYRGVFDQAIAYYEVALELAMTANDRASVVRAKIGLGECSFRLGLYERAEQTLREAAATAAEIHNDALLSSSQTNLGNVYFGQKDFDSAVECYRLALESAPNDQQRAAGLNNLASVHIERGLWAQAQSFIDQAMPLKERSGAQDAIDFSMVNQAEIFVGQGKLEAAAKVLSELLARGDGLAGEVLWETYASLGELAALRGDAQEARRNYQLALDQIERGREQLNLEEFQISFWSKWNHFSQNYVDFLVEQGSIVEALQSAEASRAALLSKELGIRPMRPESGAIRLQSLARQLNAVLLSYWVAPKRSFLWVVTRADTKIFVLPGSSEIDSLVTGYQNYLLHYLNPVGPAGIPNAYSVELFNQLVRPALGMIPKGSNVIVVADGRLHNLNFETLLLDGESPHYWIEDVTLAVAPSLAIIRPEARKTIPAKSLLLIGDPLIADAEFPTLPGVKREIESIRGQFEDGDREVIVGPEAVPGVYAKSHPDRYRWIHFAAHAVANSVHPLGSSVILSPQEGSYRLFAHDVEEVPLDAAVVTLSACRSAGAKAYSGEGLVGFAWAFLKAGAHNVVAGLWDVDDEAGAKLMEEFYAAMIAGESPAEALRQAKLKLVASAGEWQKPVYWAPFQIYTRTSPFAPVPVAAIGKGSSIVKKGE